MPTLKLTFVAVESQNSCEGIYLGNSIEIRLVGENWKGPTLPSSTWSPSQKSKSRYRTESIFFFLFCLFALNKWCCMLQIFPVAGGSNWSWTQTSVYISRYNLHFVCSQFSQLLLLPCYNYINLSTLFEFF